MADKSTLNKQTRAATNSVNIASKAASAISEALIRFLDSRSFANREAKILSDYSKNGGQLGCMVVKPEVMKEFKQLLQDEKIPSVGVRFEQDDGSTRNGIVFQKSDQEKVEEIREKLLASKHLVFNISYKNLTSLAKEHELQVYNKLSYAEMCNFKERLIQNQIMFSSEKNGVDRYTIYVRKEDKDSADIMYAGIVKERTGSGKNIYRAMDHERNNRQEAVDKVLADKDATFIIGNYSNKKTLYVDKQGLWYEQEGSMSKREFISRKDEQFEQKLCDFIDRIRNPRVIQKEMDREDAFRFKEKFDNGSDRKNVMKMEKALNLYGYKNLKELEQVTCIKKPVERMQELGNRDLKGREIYEAAYCRLVTAIALCHTEKDKGYIFVSEAEREAFKADQELHKQYEYCLIRGYDGKCSMAEKYKEETLSKEEMEKDIQHIQKEKHFTVDDMRRAVIWREKYEMPEYVDKDRDGIFDEFDRDFEAERNAGEKDRENYEESSFRR